jgi:hypothetical protein
MVQLFFTDTRRSHSADELLVVVRIFQELAKDFADIVARDGVFYHAFSFPKQTRTIYLSSCAVDLAVERCGVGRICNRVSILVAS